VGLFIAVHRKRCIFGEKKTKEKNKKSSSFQCYSCNDPLVKEQTYNWITCGWGRTWVCLLQLAANNHLLCRSTCVNLRSYAGVMLHNRGGDAPQSVFNNKI